VKSILRNNFKFAKFKIQIQCMPKCIYNTLQITNTTKVFKRHCEILNIYLKYYLKYMYFKILPITV